MHRFVRTVNLFKDKFNNFYWTIFDESKIVENIKNSDYDYAYIIEDSKDISIAVFNKESIKILDK